MRWGSNTSLSVYLVEGRIERGGAAVMRVNVLNAGVRWGLSWCHILLALGLRIATYKNIKKQKKM